MSDQNHKTRAIAHARQNDDGGPKEQYLNEHLSGTAEFAKIFGNSIGAEDWAVFAALLHDIGKLSDGWQKSIWNQMGYDLEAFVETDEEKGNHSTLGAVAFLDGDRIDLVRKIVAYVVTGHHAGLPVWEPGEKGYCLIKRLYAGNMNAGIDPSLKKILEKVKTKPEFLSLQNTIQSPRSPILAKSATKEAAAIHLWIRMLFSCLVDADYLDTERFTTPAKFDLRAQYPSLGSLKKKLDDHMKKKAEAASSNPVNTIRNKVLSACRAKAEGKPGIYTLSVPTGAGKTLASMTFALDHALANGKKRVIVAIPYTSIIEQTAKVYKYGTDDDEKIALGATLFGEKNVVEHHSSIDPDKETAANRLASENWDAPIVVTTNVQLFESLAAAKPSACRKLHNIADSVIVLDEAQLLPTPYLRSILANINHLVAHFGVTVLLCTATLPALVGEIGEGEDAIDGLQHATEIYDEDRTELFESLKRVTFKLPGKKHAYDDWNKLAAELSQRDSSLCVVNTRQSARDLHSFMPEGTYHLSTLMCGEDRSDTISEVKQKLREKCTVRLISTQLVEAGVDFDFPVVYRAFAGLDSIVQAAGRCNREGGMDEPGEVVVFDPPASSPPGLLAKGEQAARLVLAEAQTFELSDRLFGDYFHTFYRGVQDFDQPRAGAYMLNPDATLSFQFRTYALHYNLIDDRAQRSILVPYTNKETGKDGAALIAQLGPENGCDLLRRLQRYTVNVPERIYSKMRDDGLLCLAGKSEYATLSRPELYKPGKGLMVDGEIYNEIWIV